MGGGGAVGGVDAVGHLGHRGIDEREHGGAPRVDIREITGQILGGQKRGIMLRPRRHVGGVEGGGDDIAEMAIIGALPGRAGGQQSAQIPIVSDSGGGPVAEGKVHVPWKIHGLPVVRTEIQQEIVLRAGAVAVAYAKERLHRKGAQPLVHIHPLVHGVAEGGARQAQGFQHADQTTVIVRVLVAVDQPVPSVKLLVQAALRPHRHARDIVRIGKLQTFHAPSGGGRIINQLILEHPSVTAIVVLIIAPLLVKAGLQQDGGAGVGGAGRDDADQIILHAGDASGVIDGVFDQDFLLTELIAGAGTVHRDGAMGSQKQLVRRKTDTVSHPHILGPAALASLQAHAASVIDLTFVIDDGAGEPVIAHHLRRSVHEIRVGSGHHDTEIVGLAVPIIQICLAIRPGHHGPGGGSAGGQERFRAQNVHRPDIKLHFGTGALRRDGAGPGTAALTGHGSGREGPAIHCIKQGRGRNTVGIRQFHRNHRRLPSRGHGRGMNQPLPAWSGIGHMGGIHQPRRASRQRRIQYRGAGRPVEIEPAVQQIRATQPTHPVADPVGLGTVDGDETGAAFQGGLRVIVHVFGRSAGREMQHLVSGTVRIIDHFGVTMRSQHPPGTGGATAEISVLNQLPGRSIRIFDHRNVIQQDFAGIQQTEDQFVIERGIRLTIGGRAGVADGLPGGA